MTYVAALRVRNKCPAELNVAKDILRISKSTQSIFFRISVLEVSWTSWGTRVSGRHECS